MNEINFSRQRESEDSGVYDGSSEGSYENYRPKNLPEGYEAYKGIGQVCELVYDRYSSVYSGNSVLEKKRSLFTGKNFCFKLGWFFML